MSDRWKKKLSSQAALEKLKAGNARFMAGMPSHPHTDRARRHLAGKENQGDHAFATVLACSDSRVPVELLFDAGVMDLFVICVAGNVCNTDEIGSIEYGLCHVSTPVLVVLGHTQCGAVTAVTRAALGEGMPMERNIPPLVASIGHAVAAAQAQQPEADRETLIDAAIVINIEQGIQRMFKESPAIRELVKEGKIQIVGAVYDVTTGEIDWLPEELAATQLSAAEQDPDRALNAFYED